MQVVLYFTTFTTYSSTHLPLTNPKPSIQPHSNWEGPGWVHRRVRDGSSEKE